MTNGTTVVTGTGVALARLLALHSAIGLEIVGLKRRGRSATSLARDAIGCKARSRVAVKEALADHILTYHGFDVLKKKA